MTQNTEQNMRTRDEQVTSLAAALEDGMSDRVSYEHALLEVREAEARGAEEQRRKDAEGQEPVAWLIQDKNKGKPDRAHTPDSATPDRAYAERIATFNFDVSPLYTRPANVAGIDIDAVIQAVSELPDRTSPADQPNLLTMTADELRLILSSAQPANVAALEARIVELEGQITALNTPQYYAAEGDDFCRDSIAAILDECDAERNTIIQVNGYRQVSSEWVLFDGESLHVFPTENEAEAAHAALTREGGV